MRKIIAKICNVHYRVRNLSTKTNVKVQSSNEKSGSLLISCKRPEFNHYSCVHYNNLDTVPLATKGWTNSKSKNDFFIVHPYADNLCDVTYSFGEMGLHKDIIKKLSEEGIQQATEFQYKAFQGFESGSNLLLAAETGCGKTLSYILPIIQKIYQYKSSSDSLNRPKAVVLMPNRELAYQIAEVASTIGSSVGLKVKVLVGGRTKSIMMNPSFEDIDILVATPGVLGKLSTVGIYKLNEVKYLVLDEADTLMDNSFCELVTRIAGRMPSSQVILVSATVPQILPDRLKPLEDNLLHIVSPKIHKPLLNITQKFLRLSHSSKPAHLMKIAKANKDPMIVFTNKNETCNWVALFLRENGVKCSNINGDMNYAIRIEQWNQFVRGETSILSATDVASRGLNTIQVSHLLNYDFPLHAADYIHRIGRVGRLGSPQSCKATNFVAGEQEIMLVQKIEHAIRTNRPLPNVDGNITGILQRHVKQTN